MLWSSLATSTTEFQNIHRKKQSYYQAHFDIRTLWGAIKESNLNEIQTFQSQILRRTLNALYKVTNSTIDNDLQIPTVS